MALETIGIDRIKQQIYDDIQELDMFVVKDAHPWNLTHSEIRGMGMLVRRLTTRLEVVEREMIKMDGFDK